MTKCSGNTTIIEPDEKVTMLSGSQYQKKSIPKFDSPIVDIDDGMSLDKNGKIYQLTKASIVYGTLYKIFNTIWLNRSKW